MACFASVAARRGRGRMAKQTHNTKIRRSKVRSVETGGEGWPVGSRTRDSTVAADCCVVVVGGDVGGKSADAVERPSSTCDGRTGSQEAARSRHDGLSAAPAPLTACVGGVAAANSTTGLGWRCRVHRSHLIIHHRTPTNGKKPACTLTAQRMSLLWGGRDGEQWPRGSARR